MTSPGGKAEDFPKRAYDLVIANIHRQVMANRFDVKGFYSGEAVRMERRGMPIEHIPIPKPQGQGCFACGTANPIGLHLQFYVSGEDLCSDITLGKNYEGWENMAHGGILSTMLDEVMSWAILVFERSFFVTRKMEVKYLKPVSIGTPLTVKARLVDGSKRPRMNASALIVDREGTVLVRAKGEFVILPEERLSLVPEGAKKDMNDLFERLSRL